MKYVEYLCLAGTEIANVNRTSAYLVNVGPAGFGARLEQCLCPALDDYIPYTNPEDDEAPWYDPNYPLSAEYLGMWAYDIQLLPVIARDSNRKSGEGAVLSPLGLAERLVQVQGFMFANNALGMDYGERWLNEALAGSYCGDGCADDVLEYLPACPDDLEYSAADAFFRHLVKVGITDGPTTSQEGTLPECFIQRVEFQLTAGLPWIYGPAQTCMEEENIDSDTDYCCLINTDDWLGDTTVRVTLTVDDLPGDDVIQGVRITAKYTFDNECPATGDSMPCWDVRVPALRGGDQLVIDGERQSVYLLDPTTKRKRAGEPFLEVEGLFDHLNIPSCSDVCLCIRAGDTSGGLTVKVETIGRVK